MADPIDRADALDCFHDWVDRYGDIHTPDEMPEYRAIEALPSVEPETNCSEFPNNSDTISRQAAIDAVRKCSVKEVTPAFMLVDKAEVMTELMKLSSAQLELATDYISKQSVINAITDENIIRNMDSVMDSEMHRVKRSVHRIIAGIPSAQQDCTECSEYDHETKSCPKYCEVIRKTVEEVKERTGAVDSVQ